MSEGFSLGIAYFKILVSDSIFLSFLMNLFNTNLKIDLKVKERSQATTVLTSGKYDTSF